jgi:signal peptidase II
MISEMTVTKLRLLFIALVVLVADQWTKWLAEVWLTGRPPVVVVPGLVDLIFVTNTGVAFGLFPSDGRLFGTLLLTALGLAALGVVSIYYLRTGDEQRLLLASLTMVMGGAVGNLIDRIMKGSVTDFIDVYVGTYHWPTFNVADSAISIGIALMAFETLRPRSTAAAIGERAEAIDN